MTYGIGDKVKLSSGGPTMTVESVSGSKVICVWFYDHQVRRDVFDIDMLRTPGSPVVITRNQSRFRDSGGY
ncbi:YodC family protein [Sphingomonas sp.]|jgi:uncharacterized protein YodC (DUF2158 family)|uniref:YodC family protein n=1 Tax=Sphingomonas sp. TaxID=28214 RepID=UPI0035687212